MTCFVLVHGAWSDGAAPVTVTRERWGRVRRSCVHTTADRAVPLAAQLEMVSAAGGGGRRPAAGHQPHADAA